MSRQRTIEHLVAEHYAQNDLESVILNALAASGKDLSRLVPSDLAPVDEFHTGGRQATIEFAAQLDLAPGMHILDIGCGIGGASRYVAGELGCTVTGIDLTEDFVRTAEALARRVGLGERVWYRQASALDLPFPPETFDGAYMMHVGMNIEDKPRMFAQVRRVLKAKGTFGIYDVMLTGRGQPTFPLPCAATPETCFIVSTTDYRRALEAAGFEVVKERDRLEAARQFFRKEKERGALSGDAPPLGIHLLLRQEAPRIFANVVSMFDAGVLTPVEIICRAR